MKYTNKVIPKIDVNPDWTSELLLFDAQRKHSFIHPYDVHSKHTSRILSINKYSLTAFNYIIGLSNKRKMEVISQWVLNSKFKPVWDTKFVTSKELNIVKSYINWSKWCISKSLYVNIYEPEIVKVSCTLSTI